MQHIVSVESIVNFNSLKSTPTKSNIKSTIVGEMDGKIGESTLGNSANATLVDLEMDIDGNIMFLLFLNVMTRKATVYVRNILCHNSCNDY